MIRRIIATATATATALAITALVAPTPGALPTAHAAPATTRYQSIAPTRVADTRINFGAGRLPANTSTVVQIITPSILTAAGIQPGEATAAVINLTATETAAGGFLTVWAAGQSKPFTSSVNPTKVGDTVANLVTTPVSADGSINVYTLAGTDFVIDVQGLYVSAASSSAGRLITFNKPRRALDTRTINSYVQAGGIATVDTANAGVPAGATAVVLNLTATETAAGGYFTAWAAGRPQPFSSSLNATTARQTVANQTITELADGNTAVNIFSQNGSHLVVDVTGYFTGTNAPASADGLFVPIAPYRLVDTRLADSPTTGRRVAAASTLATPTLGRGDIPSAGVAALAVNVTITDTASAGWAATYPAGQALPDTSSVNADRVNHTVANHVITGITTDGFTTYNQTTMSIVADATGYFTGTTPPPAAPTPAPVPATNPHIPGGTNPYSGPFNLHQDSNLATGVIVRWNPCEPIYYQVNAAVATAAQRQRMDEAIAIFEASTGLDLVYIGETDRGFDTTFPAPEPRILTLTFSNSSRSAYFQPPKTVDGFTQVAWTYNSSRAKYRIIQALIVIDTAIGDGARMRHAWMKELGNSAGLRASPMIDPTQVMNYGPGSLAEYGNGDKAGLWWVGAAQGCN